MESRWTLGHKVFRLFSSFYFSGVDPQGCRITMLYESRMQVISNLDCQYCTLINLVRLSIFFTISAQAF